MSVLFLLGIFLYSNLERAIYFSVYSQGKHLYAQINNNKETSLVHMLSAATAGTATAMFTNPIWVAKTRIQLDSSLSQGERKYKNSWDALKLIVKEEGIRGLYKGISASILGLSESTIQFVTYEYLKKKMLTNKGNDSRLGKYFYFKYKIGWKHLVQQQQQN